MVDSFDWPSELVFVVTIGVNPAETSMFILAVCQFYLQSIISLLASFLLVGSKKFNTYKKLKPLSSKNEIISVNLLMLLLTKNSVIGK